MTDQVDEETKFLRFELARALWLSANHGTLPEDKAARQEIFKAAKPKLLKVASRTMRLLERADVYLVYDPPKEGLESEET